MKLVFFKHFYTDLYRKMTRESEFAFVIWIRLYFMGEIDETLAIMKYLPKSTFQICLLYNYFNFSKHLKYYSKQYFQHFYIESC